MCGHHRIEIYSGSAARDFQATVMRQQKQIETLTAGLQKVSPLVETGKPAPQLVNTP